MSMIARVIVPVYRRLFSGRRWQRVNLFLHELTLYGVGIYNYENDIVSGERYTLERVLRTKAAPPRPVVLDVGANVGDFARTVKALSPSARVFAFEPHPDAFVHTQAAAAEADFVAINAGCGDRAGTLTLYDYADDATGLQHSSLYRDVIEKLHGARATGRPVAIATIDDFMVEHDIDRVWLLKIDTEGHEASVLRGASRAIAEGRIDFVQFEFNAMNVESRTFFKDFLELLPNYRFYRLLPNGWLRLTYDPIRCEVFAFQNIIAVRDGIPNPMEA